LDLDGGVTHAVNDLADLKRLFTDLAQERTRLRSVAARLSWRGYADAHVEVWKRVLEGRTPSCSGTGQAPAPPWLPPAMPSEPGPGGAVHRPRLLVVATEDIPSVILKWTFLWSSIPDAPKVIVRGIGEEVDLELLRASPHLEVRVADIASWSASDLSVLSLDFDCVAFWNCLSATHLDKLCARRKPNYLMRSGAIERLASFVVALEPLERLVGRTFFRRIRQLEIESQAKVVSIAVGENVIARLRQGASATEWRHWWSSVCLIIHSDDELAGELASFGIRVPTIKVPGSETTEGTAAAQLWRDAFIQLFNAMASPHAEGRPSNALQALRKAQSAVHRTGQ
jgi:hypothetical protein